MSFENFPYSNFHELNLDWILQKLKEAYSSENPPDYPVKSVNGMTGDVIIAIPSNFVQSVNGETGDVVLYRNPLTQFPATDEVRWNLFRICDGTEKGIEFDDSGAHRIEGTRRILIYDEENEPDYPVTSVNGQTGDVQITAGVQSVNGKTGNVVTPFVNPNTDILAIDTDSPSVLWGFSRNVAGGNVALYITTGGTNPQAFIRYIPDGGQPINLPLLTNADIPESAGVVSVNGKAGAVTLYGTDILLSDSDNSNITSTIQNIEQDTNNIKENIFTDITGDNIAWQNGFFMPARGEYTRANNYISSVQYIDTEIYRYMRATNNIKIALFAWENSEYKGIYNYNSSGFIKSDFSEAYFYEYINLNSIALKFPTYIFKLEARFYPDATEITSQNAVNVILTKYRENELTRTVENHTQQISALQTANSTHTQQISALQSADATHDQQISALQSADATHDQQISALQSADSAHAQQIAELFTKIGTGIKEVKFTDVVSLPIRYPETGTDADITENMDCVNAILSRPGVQRTNLTIVFYNGYLTISGTLQGMTDITLYLTEV